MRRLPLLPLVVAIGLVASLVAAPAAAQADTFPTISGRTYSGGSAKLTVTGAAKISSEIPINTQASFGDGTSTWLQFGASGSAEPNVLVTYGETKETGIIVGQGKFTATGGIMPGEKSECSGKATVTANLVTGEYACTGLTSMNADGSMGTVNIKVSFTAKS
ncbi:MAG: hypothetical protein ACREOQ_00730 [Gemmatimonadales bacterium]